ncbi:MAG: hypothetical protein ACKO3N_19460, partial [Verrucomicrobiota bacterium]
MKNPVFHAWGSLLLAACALLNPLGQAGVSFPDPSGGWSYIYEANPGQDVFGDTSSFDALDGTWSHNNGSDTWDGSGLGGTFGPGNAPGGAQIFSEGGVHYLRIQDPGDPRNYGYTPDPTNRKIYFGHDISANGAADDALDSGVTISFRARIPVPSKTVHPLDPLHRQNQQANGPQPYPETGDGYVTSDGGKGNFVIKQRTGGAFAFSLTVPTDTAGGDPNGPRANFSGLTMNEFNGNVISSSVNFGQGSGTNVLALDPTDWHEFWIVLRKDPANIGTHEALVYVDGSTTARFFKITAGPGDDYGGIGYLAMGSTATGQNSALDVDFYAVRAEAVFPPGAIANLPPELRDLAPGRDARFADAAAGLSFRAVTQTPNSIPANGASVVLNGQDISAQLTAGTDLRNRSFTYSGLQPNRLYQGTAILTDQAGRKSTNALAFDTLVQAQVGQAEFTDYGADVTVNVPAGPATLYLRAGSTAPQVVRVERVTGGSASVLGTLRLPNTGAVNVPQMVQLTDAFGAPVVFPGGGASTFRLKPFGGNVSVPYEVLAAPSSEAVTSRYVAFVVPSPIATVVFPDSVIRAEIVSASGTVAASEVRLTLDGADVTASATAGVTGNVTTIAYNAPSFLAESVTLTASVGYPGNAGSPWSFRVTPITRLKAPWATPPSSVSGRTRGFTGRIHKVDNSADANLFPNNPQRAADQLAGRIIDPATREPYPNEAAGPRGDGSFVEPGTINYEQSGADKGIAGDQAFPNLEPGNPDFIAMETIAYLRLPRGTHRFGIACDDGFQVWAGPSAATATRQVGLRSPGGSTAEVTFDVLAEADGVYAFRLLFFEGVGGADVEWYTVDLATGEKVLVNADNGLLSYQSRAGDGSDTPPTVVSTIPPAGLTGGAFSNVVIDESARTITADLPATG